jgi:hypothetical protein
MALTDHKDFLEIETERTALFAKIEIEQAERGEFLQCLITPPFDADGTNKEVFDTSRKPSDEADDWTALGISSNVSTGTRCQYCCHRYDGPRGSGYILGCRVFYDTQNWEYKEHHGTENRMGPFDDWHQEASDE